MQRIGVCIDCFVLRYVLEKESTLCPRSFWFDFFTHHTIILYWEDVTFPFRVISWKRNLPLLLVGVCALSLIERV